MNIVQKANENIPAPLRSTVVKKADAGTQDIVKEVLDCYTDSNKQLVLFARHLQGSTVLDTCNNVFNFWKTNVTYKVDTEGGQWVQTPAAFWAGKQGDCKSFSVAVACTLAAMGIAGKFRFVSFGGNTVAPTHVYVVAMHQGREIIIDCVWHSFNKQKSFTKNWDYNMTTVYRVSGIENLGRTYLEDIDVNDTEVTQAHIDLALNKEKLLAERNAQRKITGIGSVQDDAYTTEIVAHTHALLDLENIAAIGKPGKIIAKKVLQKAKAIAVKKVKTPAAKLVKASATVAKRKVALIKRVGKGLKKVVASPVLLAVKTQLPKNAAFFLYTFLVDANVLRLLPDAVAVKRAKAIQAKKAIVEKLGMKEANFNKTVRTGIMNKFGKSPEALLATWMKDWKAEKLKDFKIGVIPVVLGAAAKGVKMLLSSLGADFKGNLEEFAPAPEDWGAVNKEVAETLSKATVEQADNNEPTQGKGSVQPLNDEGDYGVKKITTGVVLNPQTQQPAEDNYSGSSNAGNDGNNPESDVEGGYKNNTDNANKFESSDKNNNAPDGAEPSKEAATMAELKNKNDTPVEASSKSNMLLLAGAAVLAVVVMGGKKSK